MRCLALLISIAMLAGCGGSSKAAPEPAPQMGPAQMYVDKRPVWPPSGPGCAELVACCNAAVAKDESIGLLCQVMVAAEMAKANPQPCPAARANVVASLDEVGIAKAPACTAAPAAQRARETPF
jgi:hypothetical protein